jgi:hypothetical protein
LAELADAMDSKSIDTPSETPKKQGESADQGVGLRSPCADAPSDPDAAALAALLPRLTPKQRRQLLILARSMIE